MVVSGLMDYGVRDPPRVLNFSSFLFLLLLLLLLLLP